MCHNTIQLFRRALKEFVLGTFVIAEAGVNHNGSIELAISLIEEAAKAGADAIKFQTFTAESVVGQHAAKAAYQSQNDGPGSQFDMLKALELDHDDHRRLIEKCQVVGIEFMSTPFDTGALEFLVSEGMQRIKIPSGEITNLPFLEQIGAKGLPMILSTGMATMAEIREAISALNDGAKDSADGTLSEDQVTILHCTSNYPAAPEDVNLRAMQQIRAETGFPVGYSDHTTGVAVCPAAVAMGASVVEKHFTLDRAMTGPDHKASLEPGELAAMIDQIREVERALGSDVKEPTESEMEMRIVARRSIAAASNLEVGDVISDAHLAILRPASGIAPKHYDDVLGRIVAKPVAAGVPLVWEDLEQES